MTRRWVLGKKPTKDEVKTAMTNAISKLLDPMDIEAMACAVMRLIDNRISGKS